MATQTNANALKPKQHFLILDGLRGVAALSVVIFHFMEFAQPNYSKSFIGHAFLAVDFFFCLSGFVIAYAYDSKLKEIGIRAFFKLRLIRLHPLVIVGSIIGLLCYVFDPFSNLYGTYGTGKAFLLFISSCFMIPYPIIRERYFNLFHLNPPAWSLFWEYIANIAYAFILVKISNKILWILTVVAAVLLINEARRSGYLGNGWSGENVVAGAIRVSFSFLAGMLIYRSGWITRSRLGFISVSLLLLGAFVFRFSYKWNFITEPILVIFYFPLVISLGAGATLRPMFKRICQFFGELSYPLYMVHYPFLWLFMSYMEKYKPTMGQLKVIIPICVVLLVIFAWLVMIFIDIPVRKYLKRRMEKSL